MRLLVLLLLVLQSVLATNMGNQTLSAKAVGSPTPILVEGPEMIKHFVLKTPLAPALVPPIRKVVLATGCYWGSEKSFWRLPGVVSTAVGSCGGTTENPSYEEVCTGTTGHAESVIVFYDSTKIALSDLMRQFLQSHDPTQGDGQGNDRGTQYRSAVFVDDENDFKVAQAALKEYERLLGRKVTTELHIPQPPFYYAEKYMQQYLARPGNRQYCSAMPTGVALTSWDVWGPEDVPEDMKPKLDEGFWAQYSPVKGCVLREPNEQIVWPPQKKL